ncbi:MAG: diguanylate cyclase [Alphaproteobacteria bacterium]
MTALEAAGDGALPPSVRHSVPTMLRDLLAVVFVEFDVAGRVLAANAGYRSLRDDGGAQGLADFLIEPALGRLHTLRAGQTGRVFKGDIVVRAGTGRLVLPGRIERRNDGYRLIAERNIAELERLNTAILALNDELAVRNRELVAAYQDLEESKVEVMRLMLTDALTGLANRRRIEELLDYEIGRVARYGVPCAVALGDLDHFKVVNDTWGHRAGDQVLAATAASMQRQLRATDTVGRWGGEEFAVIMPQTTLDGAMIVVDHMRGSIAEAPIEAIGRPVTISFGVTAIVPGDTTGSVIQRVDGALYASKRLGRNRTTRALG